jgi:hypothetical protein
LVLQAASPLHTVKFLMKQSFAILWNWVRVHFFRLWTALLVLGAYGYLWVNKPEYLTWWKRSLNTLIEKGCDRLPYPWGDQIESTLGNFGIWIHLRHSDRSRGSWPGAHIGPGDTSALKVSL